MTIWILIIKLKKWDDSMLDARARLRSSSVEIQTIEILVSNERAVRAL